MRLIVKRNNAHTVYLYLSSSIATTRPKAIGRQNSLSSDENRIGGLVYHTLTRQTRTSRVLASALRVLALRLIWNSSRET